MATRVQEAAWKLEGIVIAFMHPEDFNTPLSADCEKAITELEAAIYEDLEKRARDHARTE